MHSGDDVANMNGEPARPRTKQRVRLPDKCIIVDLDFRCDDEGSEVKGFVISGEEN